MANIDITCPSGLTVKVRGLKVGDYDTLQAAQGAAANSPRIHDAIDQILSSCVVEVLDPGAAGASFIVNGKIKWPKALLTDRFAILLGIRRATTDQGSEHEFKHSCSECMYKADISVNLDELEVIPMADGAASQIGRGTNIFDGKLSDDTTFKFRAWIGEDERKLSKIQRTMNDKRVSAGIAARLVQLGDATVDMDIRRQIADMDTAMIEEFGKAIDAVEGGVDTTIAWECPDCGSEQDVSIPFDDGLLFPRRKKKRPVSS
jgi:hypothetical protein